MVARYPRIVRTIRIVTTNHHDYDHNANFFTIWSWMIDGGDGRSPDVRPSTDRRMMTENPSVRQSETDGRRRTIRPSSVNGLTDGNGRRRETVHQTDGQPVRQPQTDGPVRTSRCSVTLRPQQREASASHTAPSHCVR